MSSKNTIFKSPGVYIKEVGGVWYELLYCDSCYKLLGGYMQSQLFSDKKCECGNICAGLKHKEIRNHKIEKLLNYESNKRS